MRPGLPPFLKTIPSTDTAFAAQVQNIRHRHAPPTPRDLETRLRRLFPRVVVAERQLSGEAATWYVYRDGRWAPPPSSASWLAPDLPRVALSLDGWVVEANAPARDLLNLPEAELGKRHFTDFVAPGSLEDAEALLRVLSEGHELQATILLRPADGEVLACDMLARRADDRVVGTFRLAEDIEVVAIPVPAPAELVCLPASDVAFGRYAELVLSRMPEPTPDGLGLRLRRLYRHARVEPLDERWMVFRDARGMGDAPDGWWLDPELPRVRYDGQALIVEANAAAETLLGQRLVGHHWQEFVTPGATERVADMVEIIMEAGVALSRFRMPGANGESVEFDSFTEYDGSTLTTIMRPRSDGESATGDASGAEPT
jgi:PAS domain-containing protein